MNITPEYDVIVIGSGPAGIAAGITCVQGGMTVLLISGTDKVNSLRPAETVHPGVLTILSKLNAENCLPLSSIGEYEGIRIGNNVTKLGTDDNKPWIGYHINRSVFDTILLQSATRQEVTVLEDMAASELLVEANCVIGITTNSGNQIISKYVIDATGGKRFGGKALKFKELFFSPPLISWTGISCGIEPENLIFKEPNTNFIPNKYGWSWIAPTPPNACTWTNLSIKGKQSFLPPDSLKHYPLKGEIRFANMRWRLYRPLCKEGIILCGDAATIIDPASGQGILNALYSGIKAAETVISCLDNPDSESIFLAQYDDWFYSLFVEKTTRLKNYYYEHGVEIFRTP